VAVEVVALMIRRAATAGIALELEIEDTCRCGRRAPLALCFAS
jgi:hypothetical protein